MMSRQRIIGSALARIACAVLIASTTWSVSLMLQMSTPAFAQQQPQLPQAQQVSDDVRATLMQYGNFVQHQKYGEVWIPSVTPPGWHPYPPCHWVNTKQYGWYYDDKTPWGAIVHHYGRWTWDEAVGWFWVPGAEFSPGWVMWRTSLQWVGWAPTPPDEDIHNNSPEQFNNADYWIFIETAKFANGCDERVVIAGQPTLALIQQTVIVREFGFVGGILIFVLPSYVFGPFIDINIAFTPWPAWYFAQVLIDWNWFWNNVNIVINVANYDCPPQGLAPAQRSLTKTFTPPQPPPLLPRCTDGSFPNAYGACPTRVTRACGPGTIAKGMFCLPIQTPSCGPGSVPTMTAGGGTLCLPERTGCGRGTHLNAFGQCVADNPTCALGSAPGPNGCTPIVVTVPNCGLNARLVGGRCAPNGPTLTLPNDPILTRTPGGCVGPNCGSFKPNFKPDTGRQTSPGQGPLPNLTIGSNKTFVPRTGSGQSGGPYVIGRGGAGHNLYNPNLGQSSTTSRGQSTLSRTIAPPIRHSMPTSGAGQNVIIK